MAVTYWRSRARIVPLRASDPDVTSYMLARGADRESMTERTRRSWTPLRRISPLLICAVVKSEDRAFFRHGGVDAPATGRAAVRWARGQPGGGGSTITQQLARNLFLSPDRTPLRKAREIMLAVMMNRELSKERILELYLNTVEWGPDVWGIGMASRHFLQTSPDSLTPFEAAWLAALLPAPRSLPAGANLARIRAGQSRVLAQLARSRIVSPDDASAATFAAEEYAAAVSRGTSASEALTRSRQMARGIVSQPTVDGALRSECGLAAELSAEEIRSRRGLGRRGPSRGPALWD